jgi:hypothetical protein
MMKGREQENTHEAQCDILVVVLIVAYKASVH